LLYIAGDHFGSDTADAVTDYCFDNDVKCERLGARSADQVTSLQDLIPDFVARMRSDTDTKGVLICGTGAGVEIGVNRFHGIRASLSTTVELARWARRYDNANVLCLSGWRTKVDNTCEILEAWLSTEFDGDNGRSAMLETFDRWSGK
jgi:ribose 5-phosphate isomerase B